MRGWRHKAPAAGRCGGKRRRFTGVMRKCVPGLDFERGLHWEVVGVMVIHLGALEAAVAAVDGSRWRGRLGIDGEVAWTREGRGEEGKQLVSILTPLRCSYGDLRRGRSGGEAAQRAAEAWQWRAAAELGALGLFGRKAAAAAWGGEELGHGA
jgi:hypothetical protein